MMICLSDLPPGILKHTATYLTSPSRALLSVALNNDNDSSSPNDVSSREIIAGIRWDTLDFGEIEKELAAKISDENISSVLQRIDAVNTLKKIRLTNCFNITGVGLEPLRDSAVIEHIHLSLVENHRDPRLCRDQFHAEPEISCQHVLPILSSIIERGDGCTLNYMRFPAKWRENSFYSSAYTGIEALISQYNHMLENRGGWSCSECNQVLPDDSNKRFMTSGHDEYFATQNYTCSACMEHFCYGCLYNDRTFLQTCAKCKMDYCMKCTKMNGCSGGCYSLFCVGCTPFTDCSGCEGGLCDGCLSTSCQCRKCERTFCPSEGTEEGCEERVLLCEGCDRWLCLDCVASFQNCEGCIEDDARAFCEECVREERGVRECSECKDCYCQNCQTQHSFLVEELKCNGCIRIFAIVQSRENERLRQELKDETKKLKDETNQLKYENSTLKNDVDRLTRRIGHLNVENKELKVKVLSVKTLAENNSKHHAKAAIATILLEKKEELAKYTHFFLDVPADLSGKRPHAVINKSGSNKNITTTTTAAASSSDGNSDGREIFKIQTAQLPLTPMLLYNKERTASTFLHPPLSEKTEEDDGGYMKIKQMIAESGTVGVNGTQGVPKAYFWGRITETKDGPHVVSIDTSEVAPNQAW